MIPVELAVRLRDAGLVWKPAPADRFAIPERDLDDHVFVLSDMTIRLHELPDGPVLGFNGTTGPALDDVTLDEAVWLPREDQLRELLGGTFRGLTRSGRHWAVRLRLPDGADEVRADSPEQAYGEALLRLIRLGTE